MCQLEFSKTTVVEPTVAGLPQPSLPQVLIPQPRAGADVCVPNPPSKPLRYKTSKLVPPPELTVLEAALSTVIVYELESTSVI